MVAKRRNGRAASRRDDLSEGPVGYGRPPKDRQFKPGVSGNPKGRPKNSRNLKTILQQALTSGVTIREGSSTRRVSKLEGVVLRQIESALKGDGKSALVVLRMAGVVDLLGSSDTSAETTELTPAEKRILDGLMNGSSATTTSRGKKAK
jgi:hypothetical protein